ncbi:hypothetical protein C8J27_107104 [Rhodobacter aestuarii]|uniref:Uncharacterized protein n=1 Tax=Rhodobacter aestuarii TaxID=453582 RepID=A0A1N7NSL0_9RHOB|nr:hypothetical protein [Rhodobacter aestuarii]PTV94573.1 hypothetical protein C8J27_107104 [Rhodobacter aestuarii]SIT01355.1 hypothetical protein SAMN05421580_108123 [Rhodobacter aestuarii]
MNVTNGPSALPPIDPTSLLAGAETARSRPVESAEAIARALDEAPEDIEVRLAAYRFYFYSHDYEAALPQARVILSLAARRLNIPQDPAQVRPEDADFTAHDFAPGLYLQALVGIGYCAVRMGQTDLVREVLSIAAYLDPSDRFGGAWLLERYETGLAEDM